MAKVQKSSWVIPEMWKDEQCIILGGGPSLPRQFGVPESLIQQVVVGKACPSVYSDYMTDIQDQKIIGINMAYKFGNWVDVLFFGDIKFYRRNKQEILNKYKGLRVTCDDNIGYSGGHIKLIKKDRVKKYGINFNKNRICWNASSGAGAINLAVHFGVKRIILLGFDMNATTSLEQHWHGLYPRRQQENVINTMARHSEAFPHIATDIRFKAEVINANPNSAITAFPRVALKNIQL